MRKVALVTGASRNIGRAIALSLAQCNVVVHAKSNRSACEELVAEIKGLGGDAVFVLADLGKREDVDRLHQQGTDAFGPIDILVNNAAIRPHTPFLEMDESEWDQVFDTNLHSAFHLIRKCLPAMIERSWGRVINFAGLHAIRGYQGAAHVSASKHALWGLTKSLAKDFGQHGITTNIISPGPTRPERPEDKPNTITPIGRAGRPEDIAAIVSLLVSEQGALMNGQLIQANGGLET